MDLKKYIRSIPDYPKKGILFRDITTLIKNKDAFRDCIDQISKILNKLDFDKIAGIESRGFIFSSPSKLYDFNVFQCLDKVPKSTSSTAVGGFSSVVAPRSK